MAFSPTHRSQIDGVTFKLGEKFQPPQKVTLPVGLEFGNPADVWFTEYDFSLEESVVKWADDKRAEVQLLEEQRLKEEAILKAQDDVETQNQTAEHINEGMVDETADADAKLLSQQRVTGEDVNFRAIVTSDTSAESAIYAPPLSSNCPTATSDANVPAMQAVSQPAQGYPQRSESWENSASAVVPSAGGSGQASHASAVVPQGVAGGQYVQSSGQQIKSVQNAQTWPFFEGSAILTPKPVAQQPSVAVTRQVSEFDYAQFENEEDPFDQVELKTLNVMDELNKVLQSAQASSASESPQAAGEGRTVNQANNNNAGMPQYLTISGSEGAQSLQSYHSSNIHTYMSQTPVTQIKSTIPQTEAQVSSPQMGVQITTGINGKVKFIQTKDNKLAQMTIGMSMPNGCVTNIDSNAVANQTRVYPDHSASSSQVVSSDARPYKSLKEVDYPELDSPCNEATVEIGNSGIAFKNSSVSAQVTHKPITQTASYPLNMYTSHRPDTVVNGMQQAYQVNDIPVIMSSNTHGGHIPNSNGYKGLPTGANYYTSPGKGMTDFEKLFGTRSFSRTVNETTKLPNSYMDYPRYHTRSSSRGSSPTPQKSGLRSARSVPDLTALSDFKMSDYPASKTPPASSRSRTPVDTTFLSSYPADDTHPFLQDNWKSASKAASSKPKRVEPPALPDPYKSLSHQARQLVENITDMGFPRARVARAVKMFGTDDKQVVDYLFLVNRYTEQGHHASDVESAAQLYTGQEQEISHYLKLLETFRELGFDDENIKQALEKHGLDDNEALNELVAS